MKRFSLTLTLGLLLLAGEVAAQVSCPPSDPAALPIDTVSISVTVSTPPPPDSGGPLESGKKKGNSGQIIWEVIFWNTSAGPAIEINPASIVFSGDSGVANAMSVNDILNLVAQTSIMQAIASGTFPCPTTCSGSIIAVYFPSCVSRVGSGNSTQILACQGASCCTRLYQVCCPDGGGAPNITPIPTQGPTCEGTQGVDGSVCVPTCY